MANILTVCSNVDLANTLKAYLESLGHQCRTAATVDEALKSIRDFDIDIVISDIRLNEINGLELKEKVEQIVGPLPFVFLSEFADWKLIEEVLRKGGSTLILKPFKMEQLKKVVDRMLENERLKDEIVKLNTFARLNEFGLLLLKKRTLKEALALLKGYLLQFAGVDEVIFFDKEGNQLLEVCEKNEICRKIKELSNILAKEDSNFYDLFVEEIKDVDLEKLHGVKEVIVYRVKEMGEIYLTCAAIKKGARFSEKEKAAFNVLLNYFADYYLLQKYKDELERAYLEVVEVLAKAIESRDFYTGVHTEKVAAVADRIAEKLGLSQEEREVLKKASKLHDVGKIAVPDSILLKPGKLTEEEYEVIKKHSIAGYEILSKTKRLVEVAKVVLHHHEWYSGGGYPEGLKGEEIPLLSRILCLADAFHALTSDRPYRKALSPEEALQIIKKETPLKYDPRLVKILEEVLQEESIVVRD